MKLTDFIYKHGLTMSWADLQPTLEEIERWGDGAKFYLITLKCADRHLDIPYAMEYGCEPINICDVMHSIQRDMIAYIENMPRSFKHKKMYDNLAVLLGDNQHRDSFVCDVSREA